MTEYTDMPARCEDFDTEPGVHYHAHDLPRCKKPPVLGWGNPPRWICMKHYNERLAEVRQRMSEVEICIAPSSVRHV